MSKLKRHLQIKEAAKCLGVCQNALRNREAAGKIPVDGKSRIQEKLR
jgi:hypothetical protein